MSIPKSWKDWVLGIVAIVIAAGIMGMVSLSNKVAAHDVQQADVVSRLDRIESKVDLLLLNQAGVVKLEDHATKPAPIEPRR